YCDLVEHANDMIYTLDADGRITSVNPAGEVLLGRPAQELIGVAFERFIADGAAFPGLNSEHPALTETLRTRYELQLRGPGGRAIPVEISSWRSSQNGQDEVQGIVRDMSDRKRAEAELEAAHAKLIAASRQAGMAEVATSVLHNVGNVLNSVNVSANIVADQVKRSKSCNLAKLAALLQEHAANLGDFISRDPRGQHVPGYLTQLADHLGNENACLLRETAALQENVQHIKDIVAVQQEHASVSGVREQIHLAAFLDDAVQMLAHGLARDAIQVIREYQADLPVITCEKHKVLQIVINLLRNAQYACSTSTQADRRILIRATSTADFVHVTVSDNGVGILRENLQRIFNHGFTTKPRGHGFGLHSGALAAKELGGSLTVQSDGPGKGASFTLALSLSPSISKDSPSSL
ncbi:MAG: PAS domain S-box protein, partial [Verrucomicrobiota bacterium]